jgi:hypothetical protein
MPRDGAYTLADCTEPIIELVCRKCGRAGRFRVSRLIAEYGFNTKLPDLRHRLAKCLRTGPDQRPAIRAPWAVPPCCFDEATAIERRCAAGHLPAHDPAVPNG